MLPKKPPLRGWLWIAAGSLGGLLAIVAVAALLLYRASQRVPEFYRKALEVSVATQQKASDEMLERTGNLVSDVKRPGHWEALFSDAQINGWLAVDLRKNHPNALPPEISDPRVAIEPAQLTLAFRLRRDNWTTVVSLVLEPSVPEPNVLALRVRSARGGTLPLPLERILNEISNAARRMDLQIEWRQADGDPVAMVSFPPPHDKDDKLVQIETLRLGQGEIYVGGTTTKR